MTELKSKLAMFSSNSEDFSNPFDDSAKTPSLEELTIEYESGDDNRPPSKKKGKLSKLDKIVKNIDDMASHSDAYTFDTYLEDVSNLDDDVDLRSSLISMGRRYAKDNRISEDDSEIGKAFSPQETALSKLLAEVEKDKKLVQGDIDKARDMRVRNTKNLTEMLEIKSQYHNTTLQIIKELTSLKKTTFDLKYKAKNAQGPTDGSELGASSAVQKLFGIGHSALLESVGGREMSSGSLNDSDDEEYDNFNTGSIGESDEVIEKKYFSNRPDQPMTDGDKYLKYEDMEVHYVLLIDPDENKSVLAEDASGNVLLDYPMPTNIRDINFKIDRNAMSAIDQMQREYTVRYIDSSGADLNSYPDSE